MSLLYAVPAALLLLVTLMVCVVLAVWGQLFVHRRFRSADFGEHNELGGVLTVVAASLYAVLLGLLTVVAWEHFQEARDIGTAESDAGIDARHTAVGLSPQVRQRVRSDMAAYALDMTDHEWALMRRGGYDPGPRCSAWTRSTSPAASFQPIRANPTPN